MRAPEGVRHRAAVCMCGEHGGASFSHGFFFFFFLFLPTSIVRGRISLASASRGKKNNNLDPLFLTGVDNGEKVATQKVARNTIISLYIYYIYNISADGRPAARLFFFIFFS